MNVQALALELSNVLALPETEIVRKGLLALIQSCLPTRPSPVWHWTCNAPHHPHVDTFPAHLHDGDENTIVESHLGPKPEDALRQVLNFVHQQL